MICDKCGLDMRLDRREGDAVIYKCTNPACTDCNTEKRKEQAQ